MKRPVLPNFICALLLFHIVLARDAYVEQYDKHLSDSIVNRWQYLSTAEKLPYLVDRVEREQLLHEMRSLSQNEGSDPGDIFITYASIHSKLSEFQSSSQIDEFFFDCDKNKDQRIDLTEYIICRGDFDKMGNRNTYNEYYFRESQMLADWERDKYSSRMRYNVYKYDENGIIID